jgi:putative membrane protein
MVARLAVTATHGQTARSGRDTSMAKSLYSRFENDTLILRDELAIDRTLLANERTLLAYLRSAVALVIAGASMMHFSQQGWFWYAGLACLPSGLATGAIGMVRYRRMNDAITLVRRQLGIPAKPASPGDAAASPIIKPGDPAGA